jgi:hypothetical protein
MSWSIHVCRCLIITVVFFHCNSECVQIRKHSTCSFLQGRNDTTLTPETKGDLFLPLPERVAESSLSRTFYQNLRLINKSTCHVCSIPHSWVILVKRGCLGGVSEMPLLPLRGWSVSGMYVCKCNKSLLRQRS